MMLKNEAEQIRQTTLDSIKDYIGHIIVYDTGSTDGTIQVIREYCKKYDMRCDIKEGEFVDFAVSRNVLMDYCDEILANTKDVWVLQLDAHDELKNGEKLVEFVENHKGPHTGGYVTQKWMSGVNLDSYFNLRLIKPCCGWRYDLDAVVHEYQPIPESEKNRPDSDVIARPDGIVLYQDRRTQGDASYRRFPRDKKMLYAKHLEKPKEPRTLFYLAQTCSCLGEPEEAYKYYLLRIKEIGFYEEVYQSLFRLGELAGILKHEWDESLMWYMKAFQHSQRAEPLVRIAEHYVEWNMRDEKQPEWHTAYMYANMACQLIYPVNQILFVDQACYTYKRWHMLGWSAGHVGKYREGKEACLKAIEARNEQVDKNNLKLYLERELEFLQGAQLVCPVLMSATVLDRETRTREEVASNHDSGMICEEVVEEIIKSRKDDRKMSQQIANQFRAINKHRGKSEIPITDVQQNVHRQTRQEKRSQLREKLKEKRKTRIV
jgi:glycosyltransferase involved in cell wall biosynthesis